MTESQISISTIMGKYVLTLFQHNVTTDTFCGLDPFLFASLE